MRTIFRSRRTTTTVGAPTILVRRSVAAPLLLLGVCVLLLLTLFGVLSMGGGTDPLTADQNRVAVASVAPIAIQERVPSCQRLEGTTAQVHVLMGRGELAAALVLASENLRQDPPAACAATHAELARLWYDVEVEALLATPPADELLSRQAAARWAAIESRADQLRVPGADRRRPYVIAKNAYDRGLWQLSDAAFRRGWSAGEVGLASIEFRHALLRNWGHELASRGNPGGKEQALGLLATAHAISKVYTLETDVACTDMRAMGVADCAKMLPDAGEPTLKR